MAGMTESQHPHDVARSTPATRRAFLSAVAAGAVTTAASPDGQRVFVTGSSQVSAEESVYATVAFGP